MGTNSSDLTTIASKEEISGFFYSGFNHLFDQVFQKIATILLL